MQSRLVWIVPGIAFGALFLWMSLRSMDLAESVRVAQQADLRYGLLAVVAAVAFLVVKAWRWRMIISPFATVRARALFPAVCIGTLANLTISHAGELARALIVSKQGSASTSALLGSIVVERLLDTAAVLAYVCLLVLVSDPLPPAVSSASYVAIALLMLIIAAAVVGLYWTAGSLRLAARMLSWLPQPWLGKLLYHLETAVAGLQGLKDARALQRSAVLSLLQWACILIAIYASVQSLGVMADAMASVAVLLLLVVGLSLPSAPAHVGTTQLGFTLGLGAFKVGLSQAFAASLVYTAFVLLPMMGIGLVCLYSSRYKWLKFPSGHQG